LPSLKIRVLLNRKTLTAKWSVGWPTGGTSKGLPHGNINGQWQLFDCQTDASVELLQERNGSGNYTV